MKGEVAGEGKKNDSILAPWVLWEMKRKEKEEWRFQ